MLAALPRLTLARRPRSDEVCDGCGDYPSLSPDAGFSVRFGDNRGLDTRRFVIETVALDGRPLDLTHIRECLPGRDGWVSMLPDGHVRLCERCRSGTVWRIHYGYVTVIHHGQPTVTKRKSLEDDVVRAITAAQHRGRLKP
jgi:hypothetical protein